MKRKRPRIETWYTHTDIVSSCWSFRRFFSSLYLHANAHCWMFMHCGIYMWNRGLMSHEKWNVMCNRRDYSLMFASHIVFPCPVCELIFPFSFIFHSFQCHCYSIIWYMKRVQSIKLRKWSVYISMFILVQADYMTINILKAQGNDSDVINLPVIFARVHKCCMWICEWIE